MDTLVELKNSIDDFEVEFEILPAIDSSNETDIRKANNNAAIQDIDDRLTGLQESIDFLNKDIDRLTNHADGLDYVVAVVSGIIAGLVDAFFVGETEIDKEKIQKMLEEKYHTANDDEYRHKDKNGNWTSSAMYHRLDDLAHHPTLLGLVASILVRYFRLVVFIDGSDGKPHIFLADQSGNEKIRKLENEQLQKAWIGIIISGLFIWLATIAEKKCEEEYDGDLPESLRKIIKILGKTPLIIEILKTADTWVGHMMSDVSTSQGIPGVLLSFLKEISVLPILRNTNFPVIVDKLYREGKFNLPEWGGIAYVGAKKQAVPVLINEVLVRGFYFVRRLITEYKKHQNFKDINWNGVLPFGNRTIVRMMTIATGTFTAVDLIDAAIETAVKKPEACSNPASFFSAMILRVNFVGIGRFAIAVTTDVGMGIKRTSRRKERIMLCNEQLQLIDAKMYYKLSNMWIAAEETGKTIEEAFVVMEDSIQKYSDAVSDICGSFDSINESIDEIVDKNPDFAKKMLEVLEW